MAKDTHSVSPSPLGRYLHWVRSQDRGDGGSGYAVRNPAGNDRNWPKADVQIWLSPGI